MAKGNKNQFRELSILINGAFAVSKKDVEEIGKAVGVCRASVYNYIKNPELVPLSKLLKLCKTLNLSVDEVKGCLRY